MAVPVTAAGNESSASGATLAGRWKLDERFWTGAAGEVRDSSGNRHHGTAFGGATTAADPRFGRAGCFDGIVGCFDGIDDYVSVSAPSLDGVLGEFSVALWIKAGPSQGLLDHGYVDYDHDWDQGWTVGSDGPFGVLQFRVFPSYRRVTVFGALDDTWHHLTFTARQSGPDAGLKAYLDGRFHSESPGEFSIIGATSRALHFANTNNFGGRNLAGCLRDIRIYSGTLNEVEIGVVMWSRYGDVTGDGEVDNHDAFLVFQAALGLTTFSDSQRLVADVSGDGCITEDDGTLVFQCALGLTDCCFPAERASDLPEGVPGYSCHRGDMDGDGDVDLADLGGFRDCAAGPSVSASVECMKTFDFDEDGDVDQSDFGIFQRCYGGVGIPARLDCAG